MDELHQWWGSFGNSVPMTAAIDFPLARDMAELVSTGAIAGVTFAEARRAHDGKHIALHLDVAVERPQDLAHPVRALEPVAVVFGADDEPPSVIALRSDFPETMHQNGVPIGGPRSLCVDDRPWAEARLTFTVADLLRRIQLWLAKAARGELHDPAQPLEPLFFRNPVAIMMPPAAVAAGNAPAELVGFLRPDNPNIVITRLVAEGEKIGNQQNGFVVIALRAQPQGMGSLRQAPVTLAALAKELQACGIDLIQEIRTRVTAWAGIQNDDLRRLSSRVAIIVAFPIAAQDGGTADDLRAFVTVDTAGEVGAALGMIERNVSDIGSGSGYVRVIMARTQETIPNLEIAPADVHLEFNRLLGAAVSGQEKPDMRSAVMIGAGSLGSQVAINLAREGRFRWTLVDHDTLLPHNLARHALYPIDTGAPKAIAVARKMHGLLDESIGHLVCNVLAPTEELKSTLTEKLSAADFIIDASASVAVSRFLADVPGAAGRRLSVFFNPAGNAVVLLSEGIDRAVTLRDLEAQYHNLIQTEPELASHLGIHLMGLRYSGSCRAITNRISASQSAMMSAIATRGITNALREESGSVRIWRIDENAEVKLHARAAIAVKRITLGDWQVSFDERLEAELAALRAQNLPHETGGVLLGITDASRRSIHVVRALPQPSDSHGTVAGFERGVAGLRLAVAAAAEASLYQVRYIGEWHSHPRGSTTRPSTIDLQQLCWLTDELESEGLPALMAIVGDDGSLGILLGGTPGTMAPRLAGARA